MAEIKLFWPDSIPLDNDFIDYIQKLINRRIQGRMRYGRVSARQKYLFRMEAELLAYRKDGNREQLYNIGVYSYLELIAPENKKAHFDATVESVTRGRVKFDRQIPEGD